MQRILWFSRHNLQQVQIDSLQQSLGDKIDIITINNRDMQADEIVNYCVCNNIRILAVVLPDVMLAKLMGIKPEYLTVLISKMIRIDDEFVFEGWYKVNGFTFMIEETDKQSEVSNVLWFSRSTLYNVQIEQLQSLYGLDVDIEHILPSEDRDYIISKLIRSKVIATNIPLDIFYSQYRECVKDKQVIIADYRRHTKSSVIDDNTEYELNLTGWLEVKAYDMNCEKL